MTRNAAVTALVLALTACAQQPCQDGKARDNAGQCVTVDRTQLPEGFVLDAPEPPPHGFVIDPPAPSAESQAAWAADNARRQQEWQAEWDNRRAEARADARIDRIVEAQEDTRRAIEAADSGR